jgi:pSer/pThr/pTyr-binding forkhead associated (FHA) protein
VENTADQEVLSAFLTLDGEAVYEIAPNSVLNIGRLETNDIVLDDYKVSREHAVLKYSGTDFMMVDLASTHGTYVNGIRIDRSAVRFGDKIQITSHEISVSREMPAGNQGTATMAAPKMTRTLDRRLKFFGGLNEFSLITLVQFLYQEKQSGLLLLELGQKPGPRIYFVEGEIIHVSEGDNLADLLTRQNHDQSLFFYFHHETNFPKRTIEKATPNYLMDLCHSHDLLKTQSTHENGAGAMAANDRLARTARIEMPPIKR